VVIENEKVPVSLGYALGLPYPWSPMLRRRMWRRDTYFMELAYEFLRREVSEYEMIAPADARESFVKRAAEFVAARIAGVRSFGTSWQSTLTLRSILRGPYVSAPGCNFTISTNSNGLRVNCVVSLPGVNHAHLNY